jgi:hypothetical protein
MTTVFIISSNTLRASLRADIVKGARYWQDAWPTNVRVTMTDDTVTFEDADAFLGHASPVFQFCKNDSIFAALYQHMENLFTK